ncbi:MAG: nitrite/sulfite reductase [Pseudomonadota bacterium]
MYRYDQFDHQLVKERVEQFRWQVERRMSGELLEDEFKPLRLQNGVYLQLHAYMLRVAIPYGQLNGRRMRKLAHIARTYDRNYGHMTTRQNIQYNWVALKDIPEVLSELAEVEMHAIQTSGNCIRNTTSDHFAGATPDEIMDPRPWCEIIRQWSTFHPEFAFLPRKFKIAVNAASHDRAAIRVHDIGLQMVKRGDALGFEVYAGGGQGRTPYIASQISDFVPELELLDYLEAVMRVYNRFGRRDNKYKARIKILVSETGAEEFARLVEEEFAAQRDSEKIALPQAEIDRIHAYFEPPALPKKTARSQAFIDAKRADKGFARWAKANLHQHKVAGYRSVTISLKPIGGLAGDATSEQMDVMADLGERYGFDDIRITHVQNVVLPHVALDDLPAVYAELKKAKIATANESRITDMIVCPGLDYCNLANARSIPVGQAIQKVFDSPWYEDDIGKLHINISGCMNACGHHHVGHIGIEGIDRKGEEFYQITLGGRADEKAAIGQSIGKPIPFDDVPAAVKTLADTYRKLRTGKRETFIETVERVGHEPFKEAVYASH